MGFLSGANSQLYKKFRVKKGEIIEDVYYTMEKYSYLMADIDLSMSMRWERSAVYIAGA